MVAHRLAGCKQFRDRFKASSKMLKLGPKAWRAAVSEPLSLDEFALWARVRYPTSPSLDVNDCCTRHTLVLSA